MIILPGTKNTMEDLKWLRESGLESQILKQAAKGKVISALIQRGRELGYDTMRVGEIYEYNGASRKCFENLGFRVCGKTENGSSYELIL